VTKALNTSKPLFNLKFDLEECAYDVYVNGGLLARDAEAAPAHDALPINHFVRHGDNELELFVYRSPEASENQCTARLTLQIGDDDKPDAPDKPVFTMAYSDKTAATAPTAGSSPAGRFDSTRDFAASASGDTWVGPMEFRKGLGRVEHVYSVKRSFKIVTPFPTWRFFHGDKLPPSWSIPRDEVLKHYAEVLAAYRPLWQLLSKKDVNGFLDACEERSQEMDIAYYKTPGETRARLRELVEAAMKDDTVALTSIEDDEPGKYWRYDVGPNGLLIGLSSGTTASPILRYEMKDGTPFSLIFPAVFRKKNGKYFVAR
jgi:hypothetical protein